MNTSFAVIYSSLIYTFKIEVQFLGVENRHPSL